MRRAHGTQPADSRPYEQSKTSLAEHGCIGNINEKRYKGLGGGVGERCGSPKSGGKGLPDSRRQSAPRVPQAREEEL